MSKESPEFVPLTPEIIEGMRDEEGSFTVRVSTVAYWLDAEESELEYLCEEGDDTEGYEAEFDRVDTEKLTEVYKMVTPVGANAPKTPDGILYGEYLYFAPFKDGTGYYIFEVVADPPFGGSVGTLWRKKL